MLKTFITWAKSLGAALISTRTYANELDMYITSHNPKNCGDIDRLVNEFNYKRNSFITWTQGR